MVWHNPNSEMDDELLGLLPEGDAETSLAWLDGNLDDFDVHFAGSDEPLSVALSDQTSGQEDDEDRTAIADTNTAATNTTGKARRRSDPAKSLNARPLPYRQRQKLELASLRSCVAELQYKLRFLRDQHNARNATDQKTTAASSALDMSALPIELETSRADEGSNNSSVWQTLAKLQLQARAFAEQENANLKQALQEQLEMSKELERILLRNHSLHSSSHPLRSILPRASSLSSQKDLNLLAHEKPNVATGFSSLATSLDTRHFFLNRFMAPLFSLGRTSQFSAFTPLSEASEGTAVWRPGLRSKPALDTQCHSFWFAKRCETSRKAIAKEEIKTPCWSGWGLFERLSKSIDETRKSFGQRPASDNDPCRQPWFSRMRFRMHRTLLRTSASPSASWAAC